MTDWIFAFIGDHPHYPWLRTLLFSGIGVGFGGAPKRRESSFEKIESRMFRISISFTSLVYFQLTSNQLTSRFGWGLDDLTAPCPPSTFQFVLSKVVQTSLLSSRFVIRDRRVEAVATVWP